MARLTEAEKRKARTKLARKKGVSESSITESMMLAAISDGFLSTADYSGGYDCSTGDGGSSSSDCSSF